MDEHTDPETRNDAPPDLAVAFERLQAEADGLRAEAARFRTVADYTWDWEFWLDPGGRMAYTSPSCERVSGRPPGFFDSRASLLAVAHPDDAAAVGAALDRAAGGKECAACYWRVVRPGGGVVWVSLAARPIAGAAGRFLGVRGSIRDVTDRKRLEEERAQLAAVLEQTPDLVSTSTLDGRVLYFNRAARQTLGVPDGIDPAAWPIARGHPNWAAELIAREGIPAALRDGVWRGETAVLAHDGREIMTSQVIVAHRDAEGRPQLLSTIARDVTDQVRGQRRLEETARRLEEANAKLAAQAEELHSQNEELAEIMAELEAERARLRAIIDAAPEGIVVTDAQARILLTNAAADRLYARPVPFEQEVEAHAALQICRPDGTPADPRQLPLTRSALDGEAHKEVELAIVWPDGRRRDLLANSAPIRDRQGEVTGAVGVFQDITALKDAERDLDAARAAAERLLDQVRAERVRAEAAAEDARRQAAQLDAIVGSIPGGLVVYDEAGRIARMNGYASTLLGYSAQDVLPELDRRARQMSVADAGGRPMAAQDLPAGRALRGETVRDCLMSFYAAKQRPVWVIAHAAPILDPRGRPAGAVSSFADITALRDTQQRLEEANVRLMEQTEGLEVQAEELRAQYDELNQAAERVQRERALLEAVLQQMPSGVFMTDAATGAILLSSARMADICRFPFSEPEQIRQFRRLRGTAPDGRVYGPDDWPVARAIAAGRAVGPEEIHILRGDGTWGVVSASAAPVRDREGNVAAVVAVWHDITERVELESELRRARDELELRVQERTADLERANATLQYQAHLLASVRDAVVAVDPDGRIAAWNRAAEEMYGRPAADVLGRPAGELLAPVPLGRDRAELTQRRRDGTPFVVEASRMALTGAGGRPAGYVEVHRDVTERRRMEQELRASEELLRQLAENVREVFWISTAGRDQVLYVSPAYEEIWGRPRQSLYEQPGSFLDAVHPADRGRVLAARERMAGGGFDDQLRVVRADGSIRWVRARTFPVRDAGGEVYRIAGVAEDVTERVAAYQLLEERVAERTRELESLLDVANGVTSELEIGAVLSAIADRLKDVVDYDGLIIYRLSESGLELGVLEYRGPVPRDEALGQRVPVPGAVGLETVVAERRPVLMDDIEGDSPLARAWQAAAAPIQVRLLGAARSWLGVPLLARGRVIGVLRLSHDRPAHFSAHDAGLALAFGSHAAVAMENARLYEQAQGLAAMEERQRLARDLHDAVSQTLFSASLIGDVLPKLYERNPDEGRRLLDDLRQLNRGALAEMRALLVELRPQALLEVDLGVLLRQLAEAATGRAHIRVGVQTAGPLALPPDVHVALYRVAQEAIHNVAKHAAAESASINLRCAEADGRPGHKRLRVELEIADDGRGFDPERIAANSLGLSIMQERADDIGAALTLDTRPGAGTRVHVVWEGEA